ncbi:MAG: CDP-alcohol phosphatidyltransferase family protein [Ruminococcaceae bacterium]|nr:CDP-alcohol phosphatidyltransferase family protein [Oscillospiraceae bacterium]
MKLDIRDITKLPNLLTLVRIALIPLFVYVFLWEDGMIQADIDMMEKTNGYLLAAIIVVISGLTDAADGYIARKFNMITDLGKALDPFADKLTQAAVVVCLVIRYNEIWWLVAALFTFIVVKEITLLIMALLFLKKGQDLGGAKWFGKVSTIVFYVLVIVLIGAPSVNTLAAAIMIGVMLAFNILAFSLYMREYMTLYKQRKQENDNS